MNVPQPRTFVTATPPCGPIRGTQTGSVNCFKAIPYALAPQGDLSFKAPERFPRWTEPLIAFTQGATSPQPEFNTPLTIFNPKVNGENFLNLNLWTPSLSTDSALPVIVWIHGGGFDLGSNMIYNGSSFARSGVVFVALNYRLAAQGFAFLPEGENNLALRDQIAALEWVQENIEAFGGDPSNVTLCGQGSGATCAVSLMTSPMAKNLFHQVIAQSGAGREVRSAELALKTTEALSDILGEKASREQLRSTSFARLLAAEPILRKKVRATGDLALGAETGHRPNVWAPMIDGEVLTATPEESFARGQGKDIQLMIGQNTEEGRVPLASYGLLSRIDERHLSDALTAYGLNSNTAIDKLKAQYPKASPGDLLAMLQGDYYSRVPAINIARMRAKDSAATFMYEFDWRSHRNHGRLGAARYMEIPFVLNQIADPLAERFTGAKPSQSLANTMHSAWVSFAYNGRPGWPSWRSYRETSMWFDNSSSTTNRGHNFVEALWNDSYLGK